MCVCHSNYFVICDKAGGDGDTIVYKEEMSSRAVWVILTGSPARHLGQSITDRLRA